MGIIHPKGGPCRPGYTHTLHQWFCTMMARTKGNALLVRDRCYVMGWASFMTKEMTEVFAGAVPITRKPSIEASFCVA